MLQPKLVSVQTSLGEYYLVPLLIVIRKTLVVADKVGRCADILGRTVDRLAHTGPVAVLVLVRVIQVRVVHLKTHICHPHENLKIFSFLSVHYTVIINMYSKSRIKINKRTSYITYKL